MGVARISSDDLDNSGNASSENSSPVRKRYHSPCTLHMATEYPRDFGGGQLERQIPSQAFEAPLIACLDAQMREWIVLRAR